MIPEILTQEEVAVGLEQGRFRLQDATHLTTPRAPYEWRAALGQWARIAALPPRPSTVSAPSPRTDEQRFQRTVARCAKLWTFIGTLLLLYWFWTIILGGLARVLLGAG